MATVDQIANFVADHFLSMDTTVLYDSTKITSGTIQIANMSDYDMLVVFTMTNVEYFCNVIFLDDNITVGKNITYTQTVSTYISWIILTPVSNGLYVSSSSNNVNWILGVKKVVGVKFAGKHS